jgi:hypothetical protein
MYILIDCTHGKLEVGEIVSISECVFFDRYRGTNLGPDRTYFRYLTHDLGYLFASMYAIHGRRAPSGKKNTRAVRKIVELLRSSGFSMDLGV